MKHQPSDILLGLIAQMEARIARAKATPGVSPECVADLQKMLARMKNPGGQT